MRFIFSRHLFNYAVFALALIIMGAFLLWKETKVKQEQVATGGQVSISRNNEVIPLSTTLQVQTATITKKDEERFIPPIDSWESRVTKKPFGIKVSPGDSPISPERFSGYHTGTDFETFPDEQEKDAAVRAICTGPLISKRTASGYGGVAIQRCTFQGETITVVYGHLRLSSVTIKINGTIRAGDTIGLLGKGYSSETDGERKHLHLGVHKGDEITIQGYVQKSADLSSWIDVVKYFLIK